MQVRVINGMVVASNIQVNDLYTVSFRGHHHEVVGGKKYLHFITKCTKFV